MLHPRLNDPLNIFTSILIIVCLKEKQSMTKTMFTNINEKNLLGHFISKLN